MATSCIDPSAVERENSGRELCGELVVGYLPRLRLSGVFQPSFHGSAGRRYGLDKTRFVSKVGQRMETVFRVEAEEGEDAEDDKEGVEPPQDPARSRYTCCAGYLRGFGYTCPDRTSYPLST